MTSPVSLYFLMSSESAHQHSQISLHISSIITKTISSIIKRLQKDSTINRIRKDKSLSNDVAEEMEIF